MHSCSACVLVLGVIFVLQFNSQDPDIYAGTAKGIGTNAANIANLTYFQNILRLDSSLKNNKSLTCKIWAPKH
jgi:hypothetical protein